MTEGVLTDGGQAHGGQAQGGQGGAAGAVAEAEYAGAPAVGGFAEQVRAEVAPAVGSFGFALVELDAARLARRALVRLVVYRPGGMTADDCAALARTVRYRLALVPGAEDARLEVSTPGTTRTLKAAHEYAIFRGRGVQVLLDGDWVRGVIVAAEQGIVTIDTGAEERRIEIRRIGKGRLSDDMIDRRRRGGSGTDV